MRNLLTLVSGLLFGLGVTISGMVNPMKVLNFMDITGAFDPTLLFVMGAGLAVTVVGYRLVLRRQTPIFADRFHLPEITAIDVRLLGGAALFGIGWGLSGFCPGPAIASLVFGQMQSIAFVAAMAVGMVVTRAFTRKLT
ncbi:MAG: YeeE/YedE family protein [Rhizobiales bacterium]|nr:YeeE/YedE family protein [Hyphomicrobiales bacterium]